MRGDTPTPERRHLGLLLARARYLTRHPKPPANDPNRIGMGVEECAQYMGWSRQKQWELEAGKGAYKQPDLEYYGRRLGVSESMIAKWNKLAQSGADKWLAEGMEEIGLYLSLEQSCNSFYSIGKNVVDGLLQSEEDHAAFMLIGDRPEPAVALKKIQHRSARRLTFWSQPREVLVIMQAAALTHRIGGPEVAGRQFDRLLSMAARENVSIRVLPGEAGGNPLTSRSFHMVVGDYGSVAYEEGLEGGRCLWSTEAIARAERLVTLAGEYSVDIREWQ